MRLMVRDSTSYYLQGRKLSQEAVEKLEKKLAKNPSDMKLRCQLLGYYSSKKYRDENHRTMYEGHALWIVENRPEHEIANESFIKLARYINGPAYGKAKRLWLEHLAKEPNNLALLIHSANFFLHEDEELAQSLLRRAQELDPTNPQLTSRLAFIYELDEKFGEALAQMEQACKLSPPEEEWYQFRNLPQLAVLAGDFEKAEDYANRLLEYSQDYQRAGRLGEVLHTAHIVLATIQLDRGELEEAKSHLRSSFSDPNSRPLIWLNRLTKNLLQHFLDIHESECVLEFLTNCLTTGEDKPCVRRWIDEIKRGLIPDLIDETPYRSSLEADNYISSELFWRSLSFCSEFYGKIPEGRLKYIPLWEAFMSFVKRQQPSESAEIAQFLETTPIEVQRKFALQYGTHESVTDSERGGCAAIQFNFDTVSGERRLVCFFHKNIPGEHLTSMLDSFLHDAIIGEPKEPCPDSCLLIAIDLGGGLTTFRLLNMEFIDKLGWIEIRDRKVLSARSRGTDVYYIPGGKREEGESDQQALSREIKEELTIEIRPDTLNLLGQFEAQAHGKPQGVMVRMRCYTGQYDGTISASSEIEEVRWLNHSDRYKGSLLFALILDWLKVEDLID